MQVPVQIDIRGEGIAPRLRAHIEEKLAALETRFGQIVACRVVMKAPSAHHRNGGQYEVGIHLTLPDRRLVNVERTPTLDERFGDPIFAIDDVFKRARRQLEDEVARMGGASRQQAAAPAQVARIDPSGEFGFLSTAGGAELYFHRDSMANGGFARLRVGSHVVYEEEMGESGPRASRVRLARRPAVTLVSEGKSDL